MAFSCNRALFKLLLALGSGFIISPMLYAAAVGTDSNNDNQCCVIRAVYQAVECYTKAAELNHAKSAHNLAILHLQLPGSEHQQEAIRLLEQAADLGLKEVFL